ncbi:MAG TPA: HlyD family efflux transporter periplasmic adaptor subunit [Myxococcota bacterium]|jgi:HlyD family secretion protein|nr:HlyD family efflux transporter periplasmic adaptor subunit [Myxococcota bacterium]
MPRRLPLFAVAALLVAGAAFLLWKRSAGPRHYTGFVEGEERVLRSEVSARVLDVLYGEGDAIPAGAVVARLDPTEIRARIASKEREIAMLAEQEQQAAEQLALTRKTWTQDVATRRAELERNEATKRLAERTYARQRELAQQGVSSPQTLDDVVAKRDESSSAAEAARKVLARTEAEEGEIDVAVHALEVAKERHALAEAQLVELRVTEARHEVRAPDVATVMQTQLIWPGELVQPGTPVAAVLDPMDKYVQIYVPVEDVMRVVVGRRVEIELDGAPGKRFPGEVSFVADRASFTPEKIETRSDRMGQVYRAKVRILEGADRMPSGTEGNVYVVDDARVASRAAP